ncbi:hypothetical protein CMESO_316 (nucleomorph) [Chroomonas mesostigmatica CCMP1168]|uniref:Uncharacterized protein n=1 Tax=Chroomonas mesostigmatica CCMP1168 TaxID=1195612 RepID=J7G367_9CRYP|nr:hypothetical protein CMESO_316 [Chroomonas mesostigmatica CCMP1168]
MVLFAIEFFVENILIYSKIWTIFFFHIFLNFFLFIFSKFHTSIHCFFFFLEFLSRRVPTYKKNKIKEILKVVKYRKTFENCKRKKFVRNCYEYIDTKKIFLNKKAIIRVLSNFDYKTKRKFVNIEKLSVLLYNHFYFYFSKKKKERILVIFTGLNPVDKQKKHAFMIFSQNWEKVFKLIADGNYPIDAYHYFCYSNIKKKFFSLIHKIWNKLFKLYFQFKILH